MIKIFKNGNLIAAAEKPNYIRYEKNGCYVLCEEFKAQGIAVNGVPYHLEDRDALPGCETVTVQEVDGGDYAAYVEAMTGGGGNQAAEQLRRALQIFAESLTEEQAIEIATVYPAWEIGKGYKTGDIFSYGVNETGDPQLYKVVKDHTSQADWVPDDEPSLYDAIGLDEQGYPVWSPPTGSHDAYSIGDIVNYDGTLYRSKIDGNTTVPGSDDRWWELYTGN